MRHKIPALFFLCLSVILAAAAVVLGFDMWGGVKADAQQAENPPPVQIETATAAAEPTAVSTATPAPTDVPKAGPVVPEQDAPMGPEYFADAGFLGNSVTSGLWLYNNEQLLPTDTSHWQYADSLTIMGASPYAAQLANMPLGKIYMGFGINELNYDKSTLEAAFNTVIDQLQNDHPDAIIYLMSITPVSAYCDANRPFKRSTVLAVNDMLKRIADEQGIWYLDVYPALCGDDGYLPSDVTPDGVHFNGAWYQRWFDYMKTHYVPDGTPPAATEVPTETPADTPAEAPAADSPAVG